MKTHYLHFKRGIKEVNYTDEQIKEFKEKEENYYIYTHFMLIPFEGSIIHKLSINDTFSNKLRCIKYYVGKNCVRQQAIELPDCFELNKKYNIIDLIMYELLNEQS